MPMDSVVWPFLAEKAKLYEDDVKFLPYWKESTPLKTSDPDYLVSAHRASDRVIAWVVNKSRQPADIRVKVDWGALGMDPSQIRVTDAATFNRPVPHDAEGFTVRVPERDYVPVLLVE